VTVHDADVGGVVLPFVAIEKANVEYDFGGPAPAGARLRRGQEA
jgi:hypothetical protein